MIGDFFNTVFLGPIINLLVLILNFFQGLGIPGALGFAIIVLTVEKLTENCFHLAAFLIAFYFNILLNILHDKLKLDHKKCA